MNSCRLQFPRLTLYKSFFDTLVKNESVYKVPKLQKGFEIKQHRWCRTSCSHKMSGGKVNPKLLTDEEWKSRLTPEQYEVCRQKQTEQPFTGKYTDHKEEGLYKCVCCNATLFTSKTKYDSKCGWPSFTEAVHAETSGGKKKPCIEERLDMSTGKPRTEVVCTGCDSHLGHVFRNEPTPTGLRYCINSIALHFEKKKLD